MRRAPKAAVIAPQTDTEEMAKLRDEIALKAARVVSDILSSHDEETAVVRADLAIKIHLANKANAQGSTGGNQPVAVVINMQGKMSEADWIASRSTGGGDGN